MATKHSKYSKWGLAAIGGGIALTAVELTGAVGYLISQAQPSYLVAGGAIVTVVAAILPILAGRCWRERRRLLALMLWAALVPVLSLIFSAAVERTGGARDGANRDRQVIAQRIELKRAAEKEAKADVEAAEAKAAAECSKAPGKGVDPRGRAGPKTAGIGCRWPGTRWRKLASSPRTHTGSAACRHPAGLRRGDTALPASRSAGCDLSPRAAPDLSRCPSAEARKGAEAEKGKRRRRAPRKAPAKKANATILPFAAKKA